VTWIQTVSGERFDYTAPGGFRIWEIATALGNECRYGGHCKRFYSVAEHSVHVLGVVAGRADMAGNKEALRAALLHDGAEAYCKDIPRPLKLLLPRYRAIEDRVDAALRAQFRITHEHDEIVKWADMAVFRAEARQVQARPQQPHEQDPGGVDLAGDVADITVRFLPPEQARDWFLSAWRALEKMA